MSTVTSLAIPDIKLITPKLHRDERGYLAEIAHEREMAALGIAVKFVQENQSLSLRKGTLRGLHAQQPPHAQAKLVRVLRGKIWDIAVDVRPHSLTYGQHVSAMLSEDELQQFYIPAGFLHGFCTLTDDTIVLYKMSNPYAPGSEVAVKWNDPGLKIDWPLDGAEPILSDKDAQLPSFDAFPKLDW